MWVKMEDRCGTTDPIIGVPNFDPYPYNLLSSPPHLMNLIHGLHRSHSHRVPPVHFCKAKPADQERFRSRSNSSLGSVWKSRTQRTLVATSNSMPMKPWAGNAVAEP